MCDGNCSECSPEKGWLERIFRAEDRYRAAMSMCDIEHALNKLAEEVTRVKAEARKHYDRA